MMRRFVACAILIAPFAHATVCAGGQQPAPQPAAAPKGFFQISPLVVVQPAGTAEHRVHPAISGVTFGASATGAVYLMPALAVEGEVLLQRAISTQQRFSYDWKLDYVGESRDNFFVANLRWRSSNLPDLEIFGGGGVVMSQFAKRSVLRTDTFPPRTTSQPDLEETAHQMTLGGGIALRMPINERSAIVPTIAYRWVKRPNSGDAYSMGISRSVFQFGVALRFK